MTQPGKIQTSRPHRHRSLTTHVVGQRGGVPYELERRVCTTCGRELDLRPVKRAIA